MSKAIGNIQTFSTRFISEALGIDRSTLASRLKAAGCPSVPGDNNSKNYRLIDAISVSLDVLGLDRIATEEDDGPQSDWAPGKLKTYFEAKIKENQYRKEKGELVEAHMVVYDYAELFKIFTTDYQLLVEVLQQDADLKPSQVSLIQKTVDKKQEELQVQVIEYGEEVRLRESQLDNNGGGDTTVPTNASFDF